MRHESEREEIEEIAARHDTLHAAFAAEVADLDISATPVVAVMKGGTALRAKRRLTAVSGVAALAVLPVAAVAIFSGGAGGGASAGKVDPGAGGKADGNGAAHRNPVPPTKVSTSTPSPTIILPQLALGGPTTAPDPNDLITALYNGDYYGQRWRLVRDVFVIRDNDVRSFGDNKHLPMSQRGAAGTYLCTYLGVQWGDRPPGTQPDYSGSGQCSANSENFVSPTELHPLNTPGSLPPMWVVYGQADTSKVASVSVTVSGQSLPRRPVVAVSGERYGYYICLLPSLSGQDQKAVTLTTFDSANHIVDHMTLQ